MTKTKTVTEQTIHGEVEYSVVECDSCEAEIRKEEAKEFIMGDVHRSSTSFGRKEVTFEKGENPVVGYACPYCYDAGPMSFPQLSYSDRVKRLYEWWFLDNYGLRLRGVFTFALFAVLLLTLFATVIS